MAGIPLAAAIGPVARAMDLRFDMATEANTADNTSYFTTAHLPALNFPSVNGHNIMQSNDDRDATITGAGNTLGMYYNSYNTLFPGSTASAAVTTIHNYLTSSTRFGSSATSRWLNLNEIDAGLWNGTDGNAYRTWIVDTLTGLNNLGYDKIILWSPRYLASKTYQSTFQTIAQKSYIGIESYLDGYKIKNTYNYALAPVQAYYQGYYDSWSSVSNGAGVAPARLFAGEHFGVYPNNYVAGQYFGSNGIEGEDWQKAIQIRSIAIRNIPFGGFIGYLWYRNVLATGNDATDLANQVSYERAYAATMVLQSEVPTWTGNSGTSMSWADGLNWTGGLPSTTQHPYPLLAATNPTLPKQTTANLFNTIKTNTNVTLDGNQSVTRLAFDSPFTYTIAQGSGGTLTLTGSGASLAVNSGTHTISARLVLASNIAAGLTGSLNVIGPLTNNGVTLTKTGAGTLAISGTQTNAANSTISVGGGIVNINSNAGSATSSTLSVSVTTSGATVNFWSTQNLAGLTLAAGTKGSLTPTGNKTLFLKSLSINATARADLGDGRIVVDYTGATPFATVRQYVRNGRGGTDFANATWNGAGGITSVSAAASDKVSFAVGYVDNSYLPQLGLPSYTNFGGQTVDSSSILVRYTRGADANLDGKVNTDDVTIVGALYNSAGSGEWYFGDFDYDGMCDTDDVTVLGALYDATAPALSESQLAARFGTEFAQAFARGQSSAVPEPSAAGLALVAAGGIHVRRRKLSRR